MPLCPNESRKRNFKGTASNRNTEFSISVQRVGDTFNPHLIGHLVLLVQWQHGLDAVVTAGDALVELIDRFPNEKSI